jgi:hypothetical protein
MRALASFEQDHRKHHKTLCLRRRRKNAVRFVSAYV